MKKSLRMAALVGIIGLTSWLTSNTRVQADQLCQLVGGRPCNVGSHTTCHDSDGSPGLCSCPSGTWVCAV